MKIIFYKRKNNLNTYSFIRIWTILKKNVLYFLYFYLYLYLYLSRSLTKLQVKTKEKSFS